MALIPDSGSRMAVDLSYFGPGSAFGAEGGVPGKDRMRPGPGGVEGVFHRFYFILFHMFSIDVYVVPGIDVSTIGT